MRLWAYGFHLCFSTSFPVKTSAMILPNKWFCFEYTCFFSKRLNKVAYVSLTLEQNISTSQELVGRYIVGLDLVFGTQPNAIIRRKMESFSNEVHTSDVIILGCGQCLCVCVCVLNLEPISQKVIVKWDHPSLCSIIFLGQSSRCNSLVNGSMLLKDILFMWFGGLWLLVRLKYFASDLYFVSVKLFSFYLLIFSGNYFSYLHDFFKHWGC